MSIGPGFGLFVILGLVFGAFAGAMAFLITYDEYSRHQFHRGRLLKSSFEAACVAFVVILGLSLVAGFFVNLSG